MHRIDHEGLHDIPDIGSYSTASGRDKHAHCSNDMITGVTVDWWGTRWRHITKDTNRNSTKGFL